MGTDPNEDEKLEDTIAKILADFAKNHDMPVSDLCEQFVDEGNRLHPDAGEESPGWGTLPEDYDPAKDETHPMNGFNPTTDETA